MKIRILESAQQDLIDGYHFYQAQADGLGQYFLDSLFSDIDSLMIYAGIHKVFSVNIDACFRSVSRLPCIIASKIKPLASMRYSIAD